MHQPAEDPQILFVLLYHLFAVVEHFPDVHPVRTVELLFHPTEQLCHLVPEPAC
jgi:hypothetical protein